MWRCPTLPVRPQTSTIGSAGLNFRVRYENGWIPCDIITTMAKCVLAYVFLLQRAFTTASQNLIF